MSKSGQEWTLPAQLGQLNTGQDGKGLLQIHLWCPDDLPRLWDRNRSKITGPKNIGHSDLQIVRGRLLFHKDLLTKA